MKETKKRARLEHVLKKAGTANMDSARTVSYRLRRPRLKTVSMAAVPASLKVNLKREFHQFFVDIWCPSRT